MTLALLTFQCAPHAVRLRRNMLCALCVRDARNATYARQRAENSRPASTGCTAAAVSSRSGGRETMLYQPPPGLTETARAG